MKSGCKQLAIVKDTHLRTLRACKTEMVCLTSPPSYKIIGERIIGSEDHLRCVEVLAFRSKGSHNNRSMLIIASGINRTDDCPYPAPIHWISFTGHYPADHIASPSHPFRACYLNLKIKLSALSLSAIHHRWPFLCLNFYAWIF